MLNHRRENFFITNLSTPRQHVLNTISTPGSFRPLDYRTHQNPIRHSQRDGPSHHRSLSQSTAHRSRPSTNEQQIHHLSAYYSSLNPNALSHTGGTARYRATSTHYQRPSDTHHTYLLPPGHYDGARRSRTSYPSQQRITNIPGTPQMPTPRIQYTYSTRTGDTLVRERSARSLEAIQSPRLQCISPRPPQRTPIIQTGTDGPPLPLNITLLPPLATHVDTNILPEMPVNPIPNIPVNGVPLSLLNLLPIENFTSSLNNLIQTCHVCQLDYSEGDTLRRLACLHCFHSVCIDEWLKMHSTCPICRISVFDALENSILNSNEKMLVQLLRQRGVVSRSPSSSNINDDINIMAELNRTVEQENPRELNSAGNSLESFQSDTPPHNLTGNFENVHSTTNESCELQNPQEIPRGNLPFAQSLSPCNREYAIPETNINLLECLSVQLTSSPAEYSYETVLPHSIDAMPKTSSIRTRYQSPLTPDTILDLLARLEEYRITDDQPLANRSGPSRCPSNASISENRVNQPSVEPHILTECFASRHISLEPHIHPKESVQIRRLEINRGSYKKKSAHFKTTSQAKHNHPHVHILPDTSRCFEGRRHLTRRSENARTVQFPQYEISKPSHYINQASNVIIQVQERKKKKKRSKEKTRVSLPINDQNKSNSRQDIHLKNKHIQKKVSPEPSPPLYSCFKADVKSMRITRSPKCKYKYRQHRDIFYSNDEPYSIVSNQYKPETTNCRRFLR